MVQRSNETREVLPEELRERVKELKGGNVRLKLCRAGAALDRGSKVPPTGANSSSEYDERGL